MLLEDDTEVVDDVEAGVFLDFFEVVAVALRDDGVTLVADDDCGFSGLRAVMLDDDVELCWCCDGGALLDDPS